MYCFSDHRRIEIVNQYHITPIEHVKLLEGQTKLSCTGYKLEDKYYCFSYINKKDPSDNGTFVCGDHAADHFLKLLNADPLDLFNPLKSELIEEPPNSTGISKEGSSQSKKEWDPIAIELFSAIHLLIICWNTTLRPGRLLEIKKGLEKNPGYEPYLRKIKTVNDVISKDKKNRKLSDMVENLREKNPHLRSFTFDRINQKLKQENIKSFF